MLKASVNNLNDDVNSKHIIEHALSCTLERVDKDVLDMGGLRFGTVDKSCLMKATKKEAECEWLDRLSDVSSVEQDVQNKSVDSLEARSTKQGSGSVER